MQETISSSSDYSSTDYDALYIHEIENENIIKSGREWYQPVTTLRSTTIDPGFNNIINNREKSITESEFLPDHLYQPVSGLYEGQSMILSRDGF